MKHRRNHFKKDRSTGSAHWISGRKPVQEVLLHAPGRIREIFLDEALSLASFPESLKEKLSRFGGAVRRLPRDAMNDRFPGHHQGIALTMKERKEVSLEEIIKRAKDHPGEVIVVLDELNDPQNLGSILRAAEAFRSAGVVLTERRSAELSAAAVRVSAGASELVRLTTVKNLQRALELMKGEGIWVVGTALGEGSRSTFDIELAFPLALVFGSEGTGMRSLTRRLCDELVEIPLPGRIESLNVNQAVSVLLHESTRQWAARGRS